MSIFEHYWPETLRDSWPEQGLPKGCDPQVHFDYDIWGCGGWIDSKPFAGRSEVIEETDEWQITRNGAGARLKLWKNKSGTPEHVGFDVTSPEKWAEYREPLLETNIERLGDLQEVKQNLERARENSKFSVFANLFIFELMRGTMGDENFLPALLTEPEWIHDFCQVYLDFYIRHYELLFREVGVPDGFWVYEDFGYTNGLFCSPRVLTDMVMPYEKQWIDFLKDHGMQVILHSCGDIREAIPLIIDAGFDCLQPMEAKAGCDVREIAKTYGDKLCYMGNIDVVPLCTNNLTRVEAEILPKLQAMKEMRMPYIFHSDHSIPPDMNLKTYEHALTLFRENNSY